MGYRLIVTTTEYLGAAKCIGIGLVKEIAENLCKTMKSWKSLKLYKNNMESSIQESSPRHAKFESLETILWHGIEHPRIQPQACQV